MINKQGNAKSFDFNWKNRSEASYLHWTRDNPKNQIQLAFRRHWITFNKILNGDYGNKNCLEVGCGRGSLSAYFSDAGWNSTLLDISPSAIDLAKSAFENEKLSAKFDIGDCMDLPYKNGSFDLVFSIGLLEHFEDVKKIIEEQVRVLVPGGLFIGYVVPEYNDNLQKDFEWVNDLLKAIFSEEHEDSISGKSEVYRSDSSSHVYIEIMEKCGLEKISSSGIYSLPMISYSTSFPFTLLPPKSERSLIKTFESWLRKRENETHLDPWLCNEGEGQAFIVWGRKK